MSLLFQFKSPLILQGGLFSEFYARGRVSSPKFRNVDELSKEWDQCSVRNKLHRRKLCRDRLVQVPLRADSTPSAIRSFHCGDFFKATRIYSTDKSGDF